MPKVSVIIPVYNAEKYLRECLDSVIGQTLKDIEVICVDDGSIDGSAQILDEYAKNDKRIKVVHKKNEGVSIARNLGLSMAKGQYIHFVDADDFIAPRLYAIVLPIMDKKDLDCYLFGYDDYKNGKYTPSWICPYLKKCNREKPSLEDQIIYLYRGQCNRIWSNAFITEHNIKFPEHMKISEDSLFGTLASLYSPKINFSSQPYYTYRRDNLTSATHNRGMLLAEEVKTHGFIEATEAYQQASDELQKAIDLKTALSLNTYAGEIKNLSKADQQIIRKYVKALTDKYGKEFGKHRLLRQLEKWYQRKVCKYFLFGFLPILSIEEK